VFNKLGRFPGMGDEMGYITIHALAEYPLWQTEAALMATGEQMLKVATGENTDRPTTAHTYGIIKRYLPQQVKLMNAARQQTGFITFGPINLVHVPVALISILLIFGMSVTAIWRRHHDELTLLAATVCLALLANAFVCGVISGPHDRYGSRLVWLATFVILIAGIRRFARDDEGNEDSTAV
jgi:hypothetical protein